VSGSTRHPANGGYRIHELIPASLLLVDFLTEISRESLQASILNHATFN
jgi:hypothetical protein